jgi:hypothetical protein
MILAGQILDRQLFLTETLAFHDVSELLRAVSEQIHDNEELRKHKAQHCVVYLKLGIVTLVSTIRICALIHEDSSEILL